MRKLNYQRLFIVLLCGLGVIVFLLINNSKKAEAIDGRKLINETETKQVISERTKKINKEGLTYELNQLLISSFDEKELASLSFAITLPEYNYTFKYHEKIEYLNASTIKVPLNMYIYELAKQDPSILSKTIQYNYDYYEDGSGIMQATEPGTYFDVQTLLTNSIRYSDNIATNMLFDTFIVDITTCEELVPYFGNANYNDWLSTANNRMQSLTYLYNHQDNFKTLINDMKLSIYRDRIPLYLPTNIEVAVKTGDINEVIHDLAIIFDQESTDYLMTISMDSIEDESLRMAMFSKEVYEIIQNSVEISK